MKVNSEVILGIDVGSQELETHILNSPVKESVCKTFTNDQKGIKRLVKHAKKYCVTLVVLEGSGGYEKGAVKGFTANQYAVKLLNPGRVRGFARSIGKLAKTDRVDAYVIACYANVVDLPETIRIREEYIYLAELVSRRTALQKSMIAEKNRLRMAEGFIKKSINRTIRANEKEVALVEEEMKLVRDSCEELKEKCEVISMQKGIGELTAMILIALLPEMGHIDRKKIAALAGVAPIARDSGTLSGKRFIAGGRFDARRALYMAALVAIRYDQEFKSIYETMVVDNGKKKKVAIVAVMRRLLVRTNAVMRDHMNNTH